MNSIRNRIIASAVPAVIVFVGIASWSFLLTGDWPPRYLLASASIGGMLSPYLYAIVGRWRGRREVGSGVQATITNLPDPSRKPETAATDSLCEGVIESKAE